LLRVEPIGEKERDSSAEHDASADSKGDFWEAKASFSHDSRIR